MHFGIAKLMGQKNAEETIMYIAYPKKLNEFLSNVTMLSDSP